MKGFGPIHIKVVIKGWKIWVSHPKMKRNLCSLISLPLKPASPWFLMHTTSQDGGSEAAPYTLFWGIQNRNWSFPLDKWEQIKCSANAEACDESFPLPVRPLNHPLSKLLPPPLLSLRPRLELSPETRIQSHLSQD